MQYFNHCNKNLYSFLEFTFLIYENFIPQDFGPKVNFKKKKGKIGDFRGFPRFTENLIQRLGQHGDLSDFHPVELCHLDYNPSRGSAIEPHIDDTWIWGERLVTLNLVSPTVLIFTPANAENFCDCQTSSVSSSNEIKQCDCNITLDCDCSTKVFDLSPVDDKCTSNGIGQDKLKEPLVCESKCFRTSPSNADSIFEHNHHNLDPKDLNPNLNVGQMDPETIHDDQSQCFRTPNESKPSNHKKLLGCCHERFINGKESSAVEAMCTAYRIGKKGPKIEVLVPLPARSLVVVAGCSRHNWFHEIRRKDIVSRRLAMTFRELSWNFTSNDSDEILGNELLELGRTFWEMNV